jgi:CHAD domain-containing protein
MNPTMKDFVRGQAAARLGKLAFQLKRVAKHPAPDPIHDLRVAIRRFQACLRIGAQFFPEGAAKKARRRVKPLMDAAAEVRNRDITLGLLAEAGVSQTSRMGRELAQEREGAMVDMHREVKRLSQKNFSKTWRSRLELSLR